LHGARKDEVLLRRSTGGVLTAPVNRQPFSVSLGERLILRAALEERKLSEKHQQPSRRTKEPCTRLPFVSVASIWQDPFELRFPSIRPASRFQFQKEISVRLPATARLLPAPIFARRRPWILG